VDKVIISRHWDNPAITVSVKHEKIEVAISLNDFVSALAAEFGSPAMVFTNATFRKRLFDCVDAALIKVKQATNSVM